MRAFGLITGLAAGVALAFLALPIVAIFAHTSPGHLIHQLSNPVVRDAVVVSILMLAGLRLGLSWQSSDSKTSTSLFGLSSSS